MLIIQYVYGVYFEKYYLCGKTNMAIISLNINDALLDKVQAKMHLDNSALKVKLESMLFNILSLDDVVSKRHGLIDADKIVSGFQLKRRNIIVPPEEMGKGAVSLDKYCR